MKEKLKKLFNSKMITLLFILLICVFTFRELYYIYIDIYNFNQSEKVKLILKDLKREDKQFLYLKDFNEIYNENIKPIKNCYYIRNYSSEDRVPYTLWFKFESIFYKTMYKTQYYVYPKYDIPYKTRCESWIWCYDWNRDNFEYTISNPCQD